MVPGMPSYESQEVHTEAGDIPGSLPPSTTAVHYQIFSQTSDVDSEPEDVFHEIEEERSFFSLPKKQTWQ